MRRFLAAVRLILTCHCDQASRLASERLDRKLSRAERWALRGHLLVCHGCRRVARQLAAIRDALAAAPAAVRENLAAGEPTLSPAKREAIASLMRGDSK